ncbi:MAG: hypothetical protein KatS3mg118_1468 [Paracoccaceae bacterium]|nr:MAG: hypothetical protein KatS3mg118_1468 [Paracoccaceae bacterium]
MTADRAAGPGGMAAPPDRRPGAPPDRRPGAPPVLGVVLAGGQSRRMGAEKALLPLAGQPLIARVIARLAPQVAELAINANGDPARFADFGVAVLPDPLPDRPGPLAGVLAGLAHARARGIPAIVTVPCDAPFLPADLVARLWTAAEPGGGAALAEASGADGRLRRHPVFALWPARAAAVLSARLRAGERGGGRGPRRAGGGAGAVRHRGR